MAVARPFTHSLNLTVQLEVGLASVIMGCMCLCTSSHHHQSRMKWMDRVNIRTASNGLGLRFFLPSVAAAAAVSNWFRFVQWSSLTTSDSWIQPHSTHQASNSWAVELSSNSWYARSILSLYSLPAVSRSISLRRSSFLRFSSLTPKFLKFSFNWSFISFRVLT